MEEIIFSNLCDYGKIVCISNFNSEIVLEQIQHLIIHNEKNIFYNSLIIHLFICASIVLKLCDQFLKELFNIHGCICFFNIFIYHTI